MFIGWASLLHGLLNWRLIGSTLHHLEYDWSTKFEARLKCLSMCFLEWRSAFSKKYNPPWQRRRKFYFFESLSSYANFTINQKNAIFLGGPNANIEDLDSFVEYGSSGDGGHYFGLDIMSKSYGGESVTRGRHTGQLQISKVTRGAKNMTHPGNRDFFFFGLFSDEIWRHSNFVFHQIWHGVWKMIESFAMSK